MAQDPALSTNSEAEYVNELLHDDPRLTLGRTHNAARVHITQTAPGPAGRSPQRDDETSGGAGAR